MLPPLALSPTLSGTIVHHAYVVLSAAPVAIFVSNAEPLELTP